MPRAAHYRIEARPQTPLRSPIALLVGDGQRRPALAGSIGGGRAKTVLMISLLSDALQIDGSDAEVRVPELALDDGERYALARHLDCVSVAKLMRCEAASHAGHDGEVAQLAPCRGR